MTRVRSLEGREVGVLARIIQGYFRVAFGRALNAVKVYVHAPRAMLSSVLSNAVFIDAEHPVWMPRRKTLS